MATVNNNKKSGMERAVETQAPVNGPHTSRARKELAKNKEKEDPPYTVAVSVKTYPEEGVLEKKKSYYKPEEIKAKARSLLNSGKLSSQEKQVLAEILGPEKMEMPPKPDRVVKAEKSIEQNQEKMAKLEKSRKTQKEA